MESTWRHGKDSLVESVHFPWFFHVQHQDPALHAWLPQAPNVPPEFYNLTDLLVGDHLECAREAAQGIMKAKLNIEGQKYLNSSMVIPIIEPVSAETQATNGHF